MSDTLIDWDDGKVQCTICWRRCEVSELAIDIHGDTWDVCAGECATKAGIVEK